eukprot:Filipodium_phascolosomae@DN1422_c0_g1_i1.p1
MANRDEQIQQMHQTITDLVSQVARLNAGMERILAHYPTSTTPTGTLDRRCSAPATTFTLEKAAPDYEPICVPNFPAIGWRIVRGSCVRNTSSDPTNVRIIELALANNLYVTPETERKRRWWGILNPSSAAELAGTLYSVLEGVDYTGEEILELVEKLWERYENMILRQMFPIESQLPRSIHIIFCRLRKIPTADQVLKCIELIRNQRVTGATWDDVSKEVEKTADQLELLKLLPRDKEPSCGHGGETLAETRRCFYCDQEGHIQAMCIMKASDDGYLRGYGVGRAQERGSNEVEDAARYEEPSCGHGGETPAETRRCLYCNQEGHIKAMCPVKAFDFGKNEGFGMGRAWARGSRRRNQNKQGQKSSRQN